MGDPCTKSEVYDYLRARNDCAAETAFFNSYLASGKESALANFVKRCMERINFSVRQNSIGQKVPDNWRELALADSARIREAFSEFGVDHVVNADQTFVRFYPEKEYVLAPKGAKCIGGKMNSNEKSWVHAHGWCRHECQ